EALTAYFNEHILLELNHKEVQFVWQKAQFGSHDAWMHLQVLNAPEILEQFSCTITAYHEIFRKPVNVIHIREGQQSSTCVLDVDTPTCQSHSVWNQEEQAQFISWSYALFTMLILVGLLAIRLVFKTGQPGPSSIVTFG
ncbi:MAG: DUF6702 family protein, partial [Bacteroidota bacterium]